MTIFVDMDEVIADTYGAHIEIYNKDYNGTLTLEECWGKEVWHSVPKERHDSVRNHARTIGFFKNLEPIKDSQEVMRELSAMHDLYIASAAMQFPNSLKEKSDWLDKFFPFIDWTKRILCGHKHILKGDVLIDDRSYNLDNFDGIPLLFTSGHNIHETNYERVSTWQEVADKLL